jgi:hypothetical protein
LFVSQSLPSNGTVCYNILTKFHESFTSVQEILRFYVSNFSGSNVGITDKKNILLLPLKCLHVA